MIQKLLRKKHYIIYYIYKIINAIKLYFGANFITWKQDEKESNHSWSHFQV